MNHWSLASVVGLEIDEERSDSVCNTAYQSTVTNKVTISNFDVMS
jgi:hypothetical protein